MAADPNDFTGIDIAQEREGEREGEKEGGRERGTKRMSQSVRVSE